MKKYISTILAFVMAVSVVLLVVLDDTKKTYSFGLGVNASYGSVKNATIDEDGSVQAIVNIAAVIIDEDGVIVNCNLDCADNNALFKYNGVAVEPAEHLTKYEKGKNYNMVAYGGAKLEWFEQADAFEKICIGKTIDEVKAFIAEDGATSDEVIEAGCTIYVGDFIKSVEVAVNNAQSTKASPDSSLELGVVTSQENTDYSAEANGSIKLTTTVVATAMMDDKVSDASTDAVEFSFSFDDKGVAVAPQGEVTTKHQLGDDYNMVAYGGAKLEWYAQADAFSGLLAGKTADEIGALAAEDGKGVADVQTAGCTIYVTDFVKAAVKAATK